MNNTIAERGICYLALEDIFNKIKQCDEKENKKVKLTFSYIEIYNENVRDLLSETSNKSLMINEDPIKGFIILFFLFFFIEIFKLFINYNNKIYFY